jgi:2-aminoadipate transaminase
MPEDQIIEGMKRMGDVFHCELNKETIPFEC